MAAHQKLLVESAKLQHATSASTLRLLKELCSRASATDLLADCSVLESGLNQAEAVFQSLDSTSAASLISPSPAPVAAGIAPDMQQDVNTLKFDVSELKDLVSSVKDDAGHVKRIVLACERDMEDFTAAMDAVNVDLDEMRTRVDSTHSIITSRQRVEATVTAELSTMRLDMGDMQEALKAHDAWMEDVSQSLQECHERCTLLSSDITQLRDAHQAKLDAKVDVLQWKDKNDDVDTFIKAVRDMVSTLRLEVDSRRRQVDDTIQTMQNEHTSLSGELNTTKADVGTRITGEVDNLNSRISTANYEHNELVANHGQTFDTLTSTMNRLDLTRDSLEERIGQTDVDLQRRIEERHREAAERSDALDLSAANAAKEFTRRCNALELRLSGLQGASGEHKRDIGKMREEVNSLTVRSAAHDVDLAKSLEDLRRVDKARQDDCLRHKQDMDAVYEELDQKLYEKTYLQLEDNVIQLTRGVVKLSQVVGVFPSARMDDGTEEELDIDVDHLNWEDCCQNMVQRVEKTWRQQSSQRYKSVLDLVSKKADHSVLRLLQISQQHIESQLERVRHERELWKEVVDKRAQQPLQLALTLKDQQQQQQQFQQAAAAAGLGGAPFGPGAMFPAMLGPPGPVAPLGGMGGMGGMAMGMGMGGMSSSSIEKGGGMDDAMRGPAPPAAPPGQPSARRAGQRARGGGGEEERR